MGVVVIANSRDKRSIRQAIQTFFSKGDRKWIGPQRMKNVITMETMPLALIKDASNERFFCSFVRMKPGVCR